MPLAQQESCDFPAQQAACAGDQDFHGVPGRPPARTVEAHRDSRVLSIFALWRISVGCAGTTRTAATDTPAARAAFRTFPASSVPAGPALRTGGTVSTTAVTTC